MAIINTPKNMEFWRFFIQSVIFGMPGVGTAATPIFGAIVSITMMARTDKWSEVLYMIKLWSLFTLAHIVVLGVAYFLSPADRYGNTGLSPTFFMISWGVLFFIAQLVLYRYDHRMIPPKD